jgi:HTH-type transcriptional regulator/antitoxin HipB
MKKNDSTQLTSLDTLKDKWIGRKGTKKRDKFEQELNLEILAETIKAARLNQQLSQEALGKLVGVQKSQISKIENNFTDARLSTLLKIFDALNVKVNFTAEQY